jgi:hypothetical protein
VFQKVNFPNIMVVAWNFSSADTDLGYLGNIHFMRNTLLNIASYFYLHWRDDGGVSCHSNKAGLQLATAVRSMAAEQYMQSITINEN